MFPKQSKSIPKGQKMYIACPGRVKAQSMEQIPARKPKTISRK